MFSRDDVDKLPGNRVKFEIIEDSKLELLVKQGNDNDFDHVCQDVIEILESIMGSPPQLTSFDDLFVSYSFATSNHLWVLDLLFNRTPTPPVITISSDDKDGGHMMMDILYRKENFNAFVKKIIPHIDPLYSFQSESGDNDVEAIVYREHIQNEETESESLEELPSQLSEHESADDLYTSDINDDIDGSDLENISAEGNGESQLPMVNSTVQGVHGENINHLSRENGLSYDNESTDLLFDSLPSDVMDEVLEKEDILTELGRVQPTNNFDLTEAELRSLDNFNPLAEAWNDRENKVNKQRIDLTMPADNITVSGEWNPVKQLVKLIVYNVPENAQRITLKSFFKNQCLHSQPPVKIEGLNIDEKTHKAYVEIAGMGGAQQFLSRVDKATFCMCKLEVKLQYERDDIHVKKLQSLLQQKEKDRERDRLRGRNPVTRTSAEVTMHSSTVSTRDSCLKAAENRNTGNGGSSTVSKTTGTGSASVPESSNSMDNSRVFTTDSGVDSHGETMKSTQLLLSKENKTSVSVSTRAAPAKSADISDQSQTDPVPVKPGAPLSSQSSTAVPTSPRSNSDQASSQPSLSTKPPKTRSTVPDEEVEGIIITSSEQNENNSAAGVLIDPDVARKFDSEAVSGSVSEYSETRSVSSSTSGYSAREPLKTHSPPKQSPTFSTTPATIEMNNSLTPSKLPTALTDDVTANSDVIPPGDSTALAVDLVGLVIEEDEEEEEDVERTFVCQREVRFDPLPSRNLWKHCPATPLAERLLSSHIPVPQSVSRVIPTCCDGDTVWVVDEKDYPRLKRYSKMLQLSPLPLEKTLQNDMVAVKINQVFCRGIVLETGINGTVQIRLLDLGEVRSVPVKSLYSIKSTSKIRSQEPLAKRVSLYQSKVKDKELFAALVNLILGNRQVEMLVYEDERVDFLVVNEITESSFVKICVESGALRYTSIRGYPVSLNKSCSYRLLRKHTGQSGITLSLRESPEIDVEDMESTEWYEKLQAHECNVYSGGEYCVVTLDGTKYRGRMLNTDLFTSHHKVLLVDTGIVVTTTDVSELPAIFYDIPAQVIRCQVKGEWPDNLVEGSDVRGYIFNLDNDLIFNQDL